MDIARCHRARTEVRRVALPALLALAGCATAVPLQTASTVPVGTVRLSGQASFGIYCGFYSDLGRCAYGSSVPELRLAGRVGVHDRVDLGLSAQFNYPADASGPKWGGLLDGKVELWRSDLGEGRKQVLSAGLGVAFSGIEGNPWRRGLAELDLVVPLRWGYQLKSTEIFVGAHFQERLVWGVLRSDGQVADVPAGGFSLGIVSRNRAKVGLALNYEAPLRYFERGAITLGIGWLFDVNGGLLEPRPKKRKEPEASTDTDGLLFGPESR